MRDDAAQRLARQRVRARRRAGVLAARPCEPSFAAKSPKRGRAPARTVRFVASSGHELGHLGLHDYLASESGARARRVRVGPFRREHRDLDRRYRHDAVRRSFAGRRSRARCAPHGLDKIRQSPAAQVAGEAATIRRQAAASCRSSARNDWFHNPRDLWPDAVDLKAVVSFARATADLTLALAERASDALGDYDRRMKRLVTSASRRSLLSRR